MQKESEGGLREGDASGWVGVRIALVKLLFPPGEKKGANDTLELRRSSLSFMEGERHTQPLCEVRRTGGETANAIPPPR